MINWDTSANMQICEQSGTPDLFEDWDKRLESLARAYWSANYGAASAMVVGPANFNASRINKRNDAAHGRNIILTDTTGTTCDIGEHIDEIRAMFNECARHLLNNPTGRFYLIDAKVRYITQAEPCNSPADGLAYWNAKTHDGLDLPVWYPEYEVVPTWIAMESRARIGGNMGLVAFLLSKNCLPYLTAVDEYGTAPACVDYAEKLDTAAAYGEDWICEVKRRYSGNMYQVDKKTFFNLIKEASK